MAGRNEDGAHSVVPSNSGVTRSLPAAVNIITASLVCLYYGLVSVSSLLVLDVLLGIVVLVWRLLRLPLRPLVRSLSWGLRHWMALFIGHFERFSRVTLVVTGDAFRERESAIVVCNHRSWMDSIVMYSVSRQVQTHGDVKFFAKKSLLFFPVFGLVGAIMDCVIFITRDISKAGKRLDRTFHSLTNPRRRWPFWMISYLEGTRRTKEKLVSAQDFAKKRDLKPLEHVLQPRTKGFIASVHALRNTASAVYDITIGYQETLDEKRDVTPSFLRTFFTSDVTPRILHVHQRRFEMKDIPKDDDGLKSWIYKLYEEKDELLTHFKYTGSFPGHTQSWSRMSWSYYLQSVFGYWFLVLIVAFIFARIVHQF
jgi:lysocardiolipin and lysophospholipid acyltransferase